MHKLPTPIIKKRILNKELYDNAIKAKATILQSIVVANRNIPAGTDIHGFMNPSLDNIPNIGLLQDIRKAGNRIADAVINEETMCLACDFDVDGTSSAAVMYLAMVSIFNVPPSKIQICISNRMTEGYGFNKAVVDRILAKDPIPSLVVTADQGSANGKEVTYFIEETKKNMKRRGKQKRIQQVGEVIVSDHHEIPKSGGPKDAHAFVNPQRKDDFFPDKTICGCTVAMFVMAATRAALIKKGFLSKDAPNIKPLMAFSTAATISDCVSMASQTNRAIVQQGLKEINAESKPAWKAMKKVSVKNEGQPVLAESIAFGLGPMINACSRTGGDGLNAVRYYLAETDKDAERYLSFLQVDNEMRKDIEKRLVDEAMEKSLQLIEKGHKSLVIPIKNGHHGIHGIAASRIVERFGRPTIILSPKSTKKEKIEKDEVEKILGIKLNLNNLKDYYDIPKTYSFITHQVEGKGKDRKIVFYKETIEIVSGSGRSIDGLNEDHKGQLNLLECMIDANEKNDIFLGFGGHHMAAGMGLPADKILTLRKAIEEAVDERVSEDELYPKIWTDGELPEGYDIIDESFVEEIAQLEPFGRMFDYPAFTIEATVKSFRMVGGNLDTGRFELIHNNNTYTGIWFKFNLNPLSESIQVNQKLRFVIEPKFNYFRGQRTVQFMIKHAEPLF